MGTGGTGSGSSSLRIAPSLAGMRFLYSTLEWLTNKGIMTFQTRRRLGVPDYDAQELECLPSY